MIKMVKGPIPNPIKVVVSKFEVRQTLGGVLEQHEVFQTHRGVYQPGISHQDLDSPQLTWLKSSYPIRIEKTTSPSIFHIKTSMTLSEVLGKGKEVILPEQFLPAGNYQLTYFESNPSMRVIMGQTFLQKIASDRRDAQLERDRLENKKSRANFVFILLFVVAMVILLYKLSSMIVRVADRLLSRRWIFAMMEFILVGLGFALYFTKNTTGITAAGILFIFAYSMAVRYRLRTYLAKRWPLFRESNPSGAYFAGFLVMVLFCALNIFLKREGSAELAALLSYFLLILSIIIEIFTFKKKYPAQF
jgi:hypothetical protein